MFFTKKEPEKVPPKALPTNEIQTLTARLDSIEAKLRKHDTEILDVATALDSIRNKVLRKIQSKKQQEEEEEEEPQKDIFQTLPNGAKVIL